MSRYIKYFENSRKNMSFVIKDDSVLVKYNEIWNKIKKTLNIKLLKNYSHHLRYFTRKLEFVSYILPTLVSRSNFLLLTCPRSRQN